VTVGGQRVRLVVDGADPQTAAAPVGWAVWRLLDVLVGRGLGAEVADALAEAPGDGLTIVVAGADGAVARSALVAAGAELPGTAEALALVPMQLDGRPALLATGGDTRGLVYAVLELADRVEHADGPPAALQLARPVVERPANSIRGVARLFVSDVEDLP
jgi:hypothetical protein